MFQFLRGIALIAILIVGSQSASAEDTVSANFIMRGCRDLLSDDTNKITNFDAGFCSGVVMGVVYGATLDCRELQAGAVKLAQGVDPPRNFTADQAVRIVVKYIDARPERMHEMFSQLAWEALVEAWPCKH